MPDLPPPSEKTGPSNLRAASDGTILGVLPLGDQFKPTLGYRDRGVGVRWRADLLP